MSKGLRALLIVIVPLLCALPVSASLVGIDTVIVGTISVQSGFNGLSISSAVFIQGNPLVLQGAAGYVNTASSVTAASFWGDGSHLGINASVLAAPGYAHDASY